MKRNEVVLVSAAELVQISAAMRAAHYRRQPHHCRLRVVVWPACNVYPQPMRDTPADRHAMIRAATGLKKPSHGGAISHSTFLWREIVGLLPAVPGVLEFDAADVRTAEESHARFDTAHANLDLVGGAAP